VLRYMSEVAPLATIHASDIDEEAIGWCRGAYRDDVQRGRYNFIVNRDLPPLPFQADFFDLIYGISVFTHLPEDLQLKWLGELKRVAKPGGILALSTQGDALIRGHLDPENRRLLDERGFYYYPYGRTEGLPDYYQAAWHSPAYIGRVWSRYFSIIAQVPGGVAGHQDLVLCLKPRPAVI
jgi:SAM-dependent methyltransferase